MDVGATSVGKGNDQTVECSATSNTANINANSDINVQLTSNSLQESVATSRLSSLLSTLVAEPLAAAPRMPQQHSPRNTNVGEKASLPQPLSTPTFHVPPHIMGRNINNPAEDVVAHGRRLQKPRLGVRVPYRNLTSQIVTQDELAQELLERSLKKHPVHDIPEGGDLFFAIKLTQRLANRLSPGNAQISTTTSQSDQSPGKSSQAQSQQSSQANCTAPPKHPSVVESPAIPDHRDLIAILEGDGDTDWVPVPTTSVTSVATVTTPPSISHITNVKLDPVLEKELALKQLMEFQNNSRRRKSEKNQKPGDKPQRQRSQSKKEPLNKENGSLDLKTGHITAVDTENNNSRPSNVLHLGRSNSTSQSNVPKVTRKRKLEDSAQIESKRPRVSGKKVTVQSKGKSKDNVSVKTEKKVQRKMKDSKGSSHNINNNNTTLSSTSSPSAKTKVHGVAVGKEVNTKIISPSKPKKSNSHNVKVELADANLNNLASSTNDLSMTLTSIADDFPEFGRSFTTPIRTYSPKKKTTTNTSLSPNQETGSASKLKSEKTEGSPVKPQEPESVKLNTASPPKQSPDNPVIRIKKDAKESSVDNKKRRMREVDRLLMDEGAINLLYEAEHGESRRRSNAPEETETAPVPQRRILKSVRRKKKDLMLKTRLVKNAVLRLSNSLSVLPPVAARITRRTDLLIMPSTSGDQTAESQRKSSLDSRDSLQSPPPLTPVDPPSPQSFVYSGRLPIPAEASRIIRRHSSSSNFSSRSASPNTNRLGDTSQNIETSEKTADVMQSPLGNCARATGPSSTGGRKKGVPIFVRKPQVIQTYQGKKKKISALDSKNSGTSASVKQVSNKESHQGNDLRAASKVLSTSHKLVTDKKKAATAVKKISVSEKLKLKEEMSKNFQKGFQASKMKVSIKKLAENVVTKTKKKEEIAKERSSKSELVTTGDAKAPFADEMLNLTSCLAAAASAFAAEAQEIGDGKVVKKSTGSGGTSHTSSPCPSRSSKSPTPTNKTSSKKDPRVAPPLSPNAATYSNLLKTLENEGQKVRRKDGEEITKQRSSVRQNAGTYHYKDISLRRYDNLVQVILTPQSTKMKNALNLQVLRELKDVLLQLKKDDSCRAVLLTSTGSSFCQGVDFCSLLHANAERRKAAAQELAQALKDFLKSLALFSKPIVAGVHGAAVGLGVTMLPFFDMVFASDKATFYTPYAKLGQVPEGAAILTLPHMFGNAVTSELLFGCRKLTASEALHFGLVTRILWPDRFQEELIPVIRGMASQSAQSMEATKALLRHNLRTKLDAALESESHLLVQHWISAECQANFKKFLGDEDVGLQKQRMEA